MRGGGEGGRECNERTSGLPAFFIAQGDDGAGIQKTGKVLISPHLTSESRHQNARIALKLNGWPRDKDGGKKNEGQVGDGGQSAW